jgi:hypothetical protein
MEAMRSSALLLTVLVLAAFSLAQPSPVPSPHTPAGKIGASAVWQPPPDFVTKSHAACDAANPPNYGQCFIDQMAKQGAPDKAVSFSLMLYKQNDGQVGIMIAFEKVGPVDMARVMYPLRANENYGLLLVNGDPNVLDVDDLKKLDQTAMKGHTFYQAVLAKYPKMDIWPGDRSGPEWPQVKPIPNVGQQFVVGYPLMDGCHACRIVGLALFAWNFDNQGKFLGTQYIPKPPPPKIISPRRGPRPPAPQQPQPSPDQPQPAQPPPAPPQPPQ